MRDLIERLEKATGPDRQLDNAIEAAIDLDRRTLMNRVLPRHRILMLEGEVAMLTETANALRLEVERLTKEAEMANCELCGEPMQTHTVHDPFLNKDVEVSSRLTDRLTTTQPENGYCEPPPYFWATSLSKRRGNVADAPSRAQNQNTRKCPK